MEKISYKLATRRRNKIKKPIEFSFLLRYSLYVFFAVIIYFSFSHTDQFWPARLTKKLVCNVAANYGFTVEDVFLEGDRYVSTSTIIKALEFQVSDPILCININDIKKRLEKLDWVKNAIVKRNLPDALYIKIQERRPIAIIQKKGELLLLDDELNLINEKSIRKFSYLPVVICDDLEVFFNGLYQFLIKNPKVYNNISAIIRVNNRRWNIRFKNGPEIKLPEYDVELAWQKVLDLYKNYPLFNKQVKLVDLRIVNKIFIEKK